MAEPHVFEIDSAVWNALSESEIVATVDAMKEFGIYRLPFDDGEIVLRVHHPKKSGHRHVTEVRGLRDGEQFIEETALYPGLPPRELERYRKHMAATFKWEHLADDECDVIHLGVRVEGKEIVYRLREVRRTPEKYEYARTYFRDILIVLLASKGLSKTSRKSGLAKLGIGKGTGEYVTTLRLNRTLESHETARAGHPVRPHLRRGHARWQHYGPANSLKKRIWIEPCFVNADADFVSERKAYRVVH